MVEHRERVDFLKAIAGRKGRTALTDATGLRGWEAGWGRWLKTSGRSADWAGRRP
jgi:hypothetical protein